VVVKGTGTVRPLAVLTSDKLTPLAARAAIMLRARADAFVVGESVPAAIAESTWVGIGGQGVAVRTRRLLLDASKAVPNVVNADVRTLDPIAALAKIDFGADRPALDGAADRPAIQDGVRPTTWGAHGARAGDARAALLVAYSATRTFFPYFDVVGDEIDGRLDEALGLIAGDLAKDRAKVRRALMRYSEALHDGHSYIPDPYGGSVAGYSPVSLMPVGNDLVVALSSTPDAVPGDIVVSIDGTPVKDRLDEAMRFVSGSPQATLAHAAESLVPNNATSVVLKSGTTGALRTVTLQPSATALSLFGSYDRPYGTLTDLGAPDVFYVSLNSFAKMKISEADLPAIKAGMAGKRGVVLDMRGYPDQTAWSVLGYVVPPDSFGPKMFDLVVTPTSFDKKLEATQVLGTWVTTAQGFTGPVVYLTGANTQSQAEHLTSFFVSKKRGKLVGEKTSGANGTITGVQLPDGHGFTFTGMVVQHPDGSVFHAHGHTPDVEVSPTQADLRDGKDTVLLRALAELP
jgi:C-terminal processing protease CtpA/Prc